MLESDALEILKYYWCKFYNMEITLGELKEVNKRFGGHLRSGSSISFAESYCKNARSAYRCAAIWTRAILIDHPFTDGNKRTTLYVLGRLLRIKDHEKVARMLARLARRNITDLRKIEETVKNACR